MRLSRFKGEGFSRARETSDLIEAPLTLDFTVALKPATYLGLSDGPALEISREGDRERSTIRSFWRDSSKISYDNRDFHSTFVGWAYHEIGI